MTFQFAIDRGGTFTDIYAKCPKGTVRVMKLLSEDPDNYSDAPREGIRRILEEETGLSMPAAKGVDGSMIEWIRMGTTVATNALLERKGERMALLITKGFKDLLFIGNQARPKIFDLEIVMPEVLYSEVVEVDCRVVPAMDGRCELTHKYHKVQGRTGEPLLVTKSLDQDLLLQQLTDLRARGFHSVAVVLMHSYTYIDDELVVGRLAQQVGFEHVSLSHEVMPMMRIVPRGFTACADAYLTPHIKRYVQGFASGFKDNLKDVNVLFMQSDGGLTPMNLFNGSRAVLSGPAGGVVGYAVTTPGPDPVIGFDMGGTSTDVSRYSGHYEHVFESTIAGVTIQAPQLDVNTVAAGGGSCLTFRSGMFVVGPESAGAHPGPVCYCKGGPLTVTDANLTLGRLLPHYFPNIFGSNGKQPLDKDATLAAFNILTKEINVFLVSQGGEKQMSVEEVAMGFIRVANEAMCRPIRALTQAKGYDTRRHTLACFGGAGAQHACAVARALGMTRVFIHKYAGILSAFGMACADVVQEAQIPAAKAYEPQNFDYLDEKLKELSVECMTKLESQGFSTAQVFTEPFLHLRYAGTDCALMCAPSPTMGSHPAPTHGDFKQTFLDRYQSEFGFTLSDRKIVVDDIRVRGIGKSLVNPEFTIEEASGAPVEDTRTQVYFEAEGGGWRDTPVYLMSSLRAGHELAGPAVVMDQLSTVLVEPDCSAVVTTAGDLLITIGSGESTKVSTELDAIQLSIFSHRFMSIAEQMGRVLQRTAISTNIKERLDFSCALFGPDGGLVSNAPHIPVHLGAMQETVQFQMKTLGDKIQEGDVILSNHPKAGGSHLPDLTVITPVFYKGEERPVFFVASRGHHADIGGITPGSMPPHSRSLSEEGAAFKSFWLVRRGEFCEREITEALTASGTRNLSDNLSDLKAQIAANQKGINLVQELIDVYELDVVQAYMNYIQQNAELAVREMLRDIGRASPSHQLSATEYMDDGTPIQLTVKIDIDTGSAVANFSGTGLEVWGNSNAPRAITLSALIYCLRCMVGRDVPLNQGCLTPMHVMIPEGSLLDPSEEAGVVGGNVLTSQRVVDVVLKAFNAAAASQGCMNNITFGQPTWGYYETVAGGAGAGPGWDGRSGVHTHMTNTRITDPEVLETRYPVVLQRFSLREHSGGAGFHPGGDGVVRELLFRAPLTLSVLTERRVFAPYGMQGGMPGAKGMNILRKASGRVINLGAKTAVDVEPGDVFQLLTPGGGGWGLQEPDRRELPIKKVPQVIERGSVFEFRKAQESV